jgi:hypothetical protein
LIIQQAYDDHHTDKGLPVEIFLNDELLPVEGITAETTLTDLALAVDEQLGDSGLTLVELTIDDETIDLDDAETMGRRLVAGCGRIEFFAATAADLVRWGVADHHEALSHLEEQSRAVAAELRLGHVKNAMDALLPLLDGLEWLTTMIRHLDQGFPKAFEETGLDHERGQILQRLAEVMTTTKQAQEHQDWIGLADFLEYEMPEVFGPGRALFKRLEPLLAEEEAASAD